MRVSLKVSRKIGLNKRVTQPKVNLVTQSTHFWAHYVHSLLSFQLARFSAHSVLSLLSAQFSAHLVLSSLRYQLKKSAVDSALSALSSQRTQISAH